MKHVLRVIRQTTFGLWIRSCNYNHVKLWDDTTCPGIQLNTLRSRQNGPHCEDDIFKCIFVNEDVWIPLKILLKFVLKSPIDNIPALVQIMAWRRPDDKPVSEPMMFTYAYMRHSASMSLNGSNQIVIKVKLLMSDSTCASHDNIVCVFKSLHIYIYIYICNDV